MATNKLKLNYEKTKYVIFCTKKKLWTLESKVSYKNKRISILEEVSAIKYLGIIWDQHLTLLANAKYLIGLLWLIYWVFKM